MAGAVFPWDVLPGPPVDDREPVGIPGDVGADASKKLCECLSSLKAKGAISAQHLCAISYYAHAAGARGDISDLAMAPGNANSGAYQHHLDKLDGTADERSDLYPLYLQPCDKLEGYCSVKIYSCVPSARATWCRNHNGAECRTS